MKYKSKDIIEFIVNKQGYTDKLDEFNISDWYGYKNSKGEEVRVKCVSIPDAKKNYNFNQGKLSNVGKRIAILNLDNNLHIYEIDDFNSNQFVINAENRNIKKGKAKLIDENIKLETIILENISIANSTIEGIIQRVSDSENIDHNAIKKLFLHNNEKKCGYCGVSQVQIDCLDDQIKDKKLNDYGLTKRARGYKLEVDQIIPDKGYIEGNIILCCYWCNNAKTDTFTVKEFKNIAHGIYKVWEERLMKLEKKVQCERHIDFPYETYRNIID